MSFSTAHGKALTGDDRMPFGKFKGESLAAISKDYWRALLALTSFAEDWPELAEYARNRDGVFVKKQKFGKQKAEMRPKPDAFAATRALAEFVKLKEELGR